MLLCNILTAVEVMMVAFNTVLLHVGWQVRCSATSWWPLVLFCNMLVAVYIVLVASIVVLQCVRCHWCCSVTCGLDYFGSTFY